MSDLDRLLLSVDAPAASTGFRDRVMTELRRDSAAGQVSRSRRLLVGLFGLLVGGPLLLLTAEGAHALTVAAAGETRDVLWLVALLVVTSIAAMLPLQLMES